MSPLALDTSMALPMVMESHEFADAAAAWLGGRSARLTGHSQAETYSVMTRYPGDARVAPPDAARLLAATFGAPMTLSRSMTAKLPSVLAGADISGGAVYDALVALAAIEHDAELATRDARAQRTYEALGARVIVVG